MSDERLLYLHYMQTGRTDIASSECLSAGARWAAIVRQHVAAVGCDPLDAAKLIELARANAARDEDVYLQIWSGCWKAVDLAARYKCSVEEIYAMRERGAGIVAQRAEYDAAMAVKEEKERADERRAYEARVAVGMERRQQERAKRRRASALGWETRRRRARRADEVVAALTWLWDVHQARQAA
jgi:hypothetical protein